VMQTFILAAETAGLGCCPISAVRNNPDAVAALLHLPDKVFPVAGLCAGYPAAAGYLSMRLPLAVALHTDRYDDTYLGAGVDDYIPDAVRGVFELRRLPRRRERFS